MNIEEFISIIDKYVELFTKYDRLMEKKSHSQVKQEEIDTTNLLMNEVCIEYSKKLVDLEYRELIELRDALLLKLKEINLKIPKIEAEIKDLEVQYAEALKKWDMKTYLESNGKAFAKETELEVLRHSKTSYSLFVENINSWIKLRKPQTNGY